MGGVSVPTLAQCAASGNNSDCEKGVTYRSTAIYTCCRQGLAGEAKWLFVERRRAWIRGQGAFKQPERENS